MREIRKYLEKVKMKTRHIAALFTIAETWKQPEFPSTGKWMNKEDVVYIYTIEYYSAIKNNEIMPFAVTWMNLEIIILDEVSQTEKDKYHIISLTCGIWKKKDTSELISKTERDSQT